jgi:cyclin A
MRAETLFLCINYIDRFSSKVFIKRKDYQLVGVACLLIASKYEEIYPPSASEYVHYTDHAYTKS